MKIKNRTAQGAASSRKQNGKTSQKGGKSAGKKPLTETFSYQERSVPRVSQRFLRYAQEIIYPGDASDPQLLPARTPAQLCPRVIRKSFVLGPANIDTNGCSAVVMEADMYTPAYVIKGAAQTLGPARIQCMSDRLTATQKGTDGVMKFTNGEDGSQIMLNLIPIADSAALEYNGFIVNVPAATSLDYYVSQVSQFVRVGKLAVYYKTAGAWTSLNSSPALPGLGKQVQVTGVAVPAGTTALAFLITDQDGAQLTGRSYVINVDLIIGTSASQVSVTSQQGTMNLFQEIPRYILDNDITDGRVTSMSVLATNTSSVLEKQGQVYAARMQRDALRSVAELPSHISALPANRRYVGPAQNGAYVWWMPDVETISEPAPIHEWIQHANKQDCIVLFFKGLDPNSSFNLSFSWKVEFHTPNQLFEKRLTPPYSTEWERVRYLLGVMGAASCNPAHYELFKSLLDQGKRGIRDLAEHYYENKGLYDGLFAILSKALI